jgi:alpha-glucosidase
LTLRGTPTLYYGDEIGMSDGVIPPQLEQDPWGKFQPGLGRDPARTPMQWDATANAGFCAVGVQPWLPVAENFAEINVDRQRHQPQSMLNLTKQLLQIRRTHSALALGTYHTVYQDEQVFAFERQFETQRYLIAINCSAEMTVEIPVTDGEILLSTYLDRQELVTTRVGLRTDEGILIKLS